MKARVDAEGPTVLADIDRANRQNVAAEWKVVAEKQAEVGIDAFVDALWNQMCLPDGGSRSRARRPSCRATPAATTATRTTALLPLGDRVTPSANTGR